MFKFIVKAFTDKSKSQATLLEFFHFGKNSWLSATRLTPLGLNVTYLPLSLHNFNDNWLNPIPSLYTAAQYNLKNPVTF